MFQGLKVIELANVLAGPMVGMFFSELNARVIKVENKKTNGDMTRRWKLPSEDKNASVSAYYSSINYNKEVLFLDLYDQKDKELIYQEVKDADIVIANFKAGSDKKLGMDYDTLSAINPRIIYGHISGFGDNSTRPAFDLVLQAETGFMSMNGQPNSPPTKMPVALIDVLTAHQLKEGILTALWKREKTGIGYLVRTSLFDSAVSSLVNQATNWLMAGHIAERNGSLHPNIAPYGELFKTKDNIVFTLAIGTDKQFEQLCNIINIEVYKSEKFSINEERVKNRTQLEQILQTAIKTFDSSDLFKSFDIKEIPFGVIKNIKEVFENDQIQKFILEDTIDGITCKRPKSVAFNIEQQ